jgi:N6-adenosine-specific RNA methylase IME4/ParB-like chromosome segregation protein Spo0J
MTAPGFHPLANLFPPLDGTEFDELVADIRANGLREPIILFEGAILDGRNRLRACEVAGIQTAFRPYRGNDPLGYVISVNLRRRHLSESQRAMVAAKLATLTHGQRQSGQLAGVPTQDEAAALLNVGERSVRRAAEVRDQGIAELQSAVERGEVSVSAAGDVATLPEHQQTEVVAKGEREILKAAKTIRAKKAKKRHRERVQRIADISRRNAALPGGRRYPIIYADPPWRFEVYDEETGTERSAGMHYPCMSIADISAMPISDLATDDAVLFLWTTNTHLDDAIEVIRAWGFTYKTNAVWVKPSVGLGYLVRNRHELFLIATKGDIPAPLPANRPDSVIEHSRKPDAAYELIDGMYPGLPRIELFARQARPGWDVWGNEAPAPVSEMPDIPPFLRREVVR